MCLHYLDTKKTKEYKEKTEPIVAYKVVKRTIDNEEQFYPPYVAGIASTDSFCAGKNIAKTIRNIYCMFNLHMTNGIEEETLCYQSGFHSCLSVEDAKKLIKMFFVNLKKTDKLIIIKVKIDPESVICFGGQADLDVIVSKEITIDDFTDLNYN